MKARHKASGVELEVARKYPNAEYYATRGGSTINAFDPEWELVPEEEWEDVSRDIVLQKKGDGTVRGYHHLEPCLIVFEGFQVVAIDGPYHGSAFIVEKKKEAGL